MVFGKFPGSKIVGKKSIFSIFLVSRNIFKKGDFCQLLASKNYEEIWHCFNIFYNFSVLENFGMSPVL